MSYNEKYYNGRAVSGSLRVIGIGTITTTGIGTTSNTAYSVDGTLGDWEIVGGEANLYVINHKDNKKYKITLEEVS